jgi:pyruvate ferredoxin oxidoreductase gamma subunit
MNDVVEIRWHGRGGQGTATAARMTAAMASAEGKHFQAFPAFRDDAPPRRGEPVVAFTRISDAPIEEHAEAGSPGIVVVFDASLLGRPEVTQGLPDDAIVLVNSDLSPEQLREKNALRGFRLYCVSASRIARETAAADYPNTALIGALSRVTGLFPLETVAAGVRADLSKNFPAQVVEANVEAARRSYGEVRGERDNTAAAPVG